MYRSTATMVVTTTAGTYEIGGWLRLKPSAAGNFVLVWGCYGSNVSLLRAGSWLRYTQTVF